MLIMSVMIPNEWELLKQDWKNFGTFCMNLPTYFKQLLVYILKIPELISSSSATHELAHKMVHPHHAFESDSAPAPTPAATTPPPAVTPPPPPAGGKA